MESLLNFFRVVCSRIRSIMLMLRGAVVGRKVSIGSRCRFDQPKTLSLGHRVTMEQDVYLKCVRQTAKLTIGACSFLGKGVEIDCQESVYIGSHVLISPGCFITDHNHGVLAEKRIDQQPCKANSIKIDNDVWLGAKVVVLPGVTIGKGAVVGAGAIVNSDVDSYTIVAGVPAQVIGHRTDKK